MGPEGATQQDRSCPPSSPGCVDVWLALSPRPPSTLTGESLSAPASCRAHLLADPGPPCPLPEKLAGERLTLVPLAGILWRRLQSPHKAGVQVAKDEQMTQQKPLSSEPLPGPGVAGTVWEAGWVGSCLQHVFVAQCGVCVIRPKLEFRGWRNP